MAGRRCWSGSAGAALLERLCWSGSAGAALLERLCWEPALAALADAEALLPRPLAFSCVPYGHLAGPARDGLWRLGDQAAVIPSFCGDGMAIALESGRLAAAMLADGASAAAYQRALLLRTRRPVRLAMAALRLARHPVGRWAAMVGLSAVPGGRALLARLTRVAELRPRARSSRGTPGLMPSRRCSMAFTYRAFTPT